MSKPSLPPHPANRKKAQAVHTHSYDRDSDRRGRCSSDPGPSSPGDSVSDRRLIAALLDVMEWDRAYEMVALRAMFPNTSMDSLREALHALWIDRRVERVGVSGWRRQESMRDGRPAPLVESAL
jgi:hypothetical protein